MSEITSDINDVDMIGHDLKQAIDHLRQHDERRALGAVTQALSRLQALQAKLQAE